MSSGWLNIRFGSYHIQWDYGSFFPSWGRNAFHDEEKIKNPDWKWFEFYEIRWPWRF